MHIQVVPCPLQLTSQSCGLDMREKRDTTPGESGERFSKQLSRHMHACCTAMLRQHHAGALRGENAPHNIDHHIDRAHSYMSPCVAQSMRRHRRTRGSRGVAPSSYKGWAMQVLAMQHTAPVQISQYLGIYPTHNICAAVSDCDIS